MVDLYDLRMDDTVIREMDVEGGVEHNLGNALEPRTAMLKDYGAGVVQGGPVRVRAPEVRVSDV